MSRRALLSLAGAGALLTVAACADGPDIEVTRTSETVDPPESAAEVLAMAQLAPAPDGVETELTASGSISEFELWAVEVTLACSRAAVEEWVLASYGDPDGAARAWVTPTKAKEALGIDDVPDTWRIEEASVQGTGYERIVLIDDSDPQTVRIRLSEIL